MGDSYSTYKGYIPSGYQSYYSDERIEQPVVNGVDKTWWKILANQKQLQIFNDSFSGSTICTTVREQLTIETSFVKRMDKYLGADYFTKNKIDTIILFGGTNDSWIDAPIGELLFDDWNDTNLKSVIPAFCYLLYSVKKIQGNPYVFLVINSDLKEDITEKLVEACEWYKVDYVQLKEIDKQNGHPTVLGMQQIAQQIENVWANKECI